MLERRSRLLCNEKLHQNNNRREIHITSGAKVRLFQNCVLTSYLEKLFYSLEYVHQKSTCRNAVLFILSGGSNPSTHITKFARKCANDNLKILSLGLAQEYVIFKIYCVSIFYFIL